MLLFKSERSYKPVIGIVTMVLMVFIILLMADISSGSFLIVLMFLVPFLLLALWFWFNVRYVISEEKKLLSIHTGGFEKQHIFIKNISRILVNGSAEIEGLEIEYNQKEMVIVNPADKQSFIIALQKIEPRIRLAQ